MELIARAARAPELEAVAIQVRAAEPDRRHENAARLWEEGGNARHVAAWVDDPKQVSAAQMEKWVKGFDRWDVCDGTCCHLFCFAEPRWAKARAWTKRRAEFERRAGFALIAFLAVHDKKAADGEFAGLFPLIRAASDDERHFVKKAVNWALRQIGKRNTRLNGLAIAEAKRIRERGTAAARWIAADALRALRSDAVRRRLKFT